MQPEAIPTIVRPSVLIDALLGPEEDTEEPNVALLKRGREKYSIYIYSCVIYNQRHVYKNIYICILSLYTSMYILCAYIMYVCIYIYIERERDIHMSSR